MKSRIPMYIGIQKETKMPSNPNQTPAEPRETIAKLTRQINETRAQLARTERERVEQKCMLRDANARITELVRGAESQGRRIAELEAASESPPQAGLAIGTPPQECD